MLDSLWGKRPPLGSLERQVMDVMWAGGEYTVRDVQARLSKPVAYTTAMTTLDRLYKKGLVTRTQSGRAFVYAPAQSREQFETAVANGVVAGLIARRTDAALPILSNLVEAVGDQDDAADLLDALEALVRDKRRRLGGEGGER